MDSATTASLAKRSQARSNMSTALWGHLLRKTGTSDVPPSSITSTSTLGKPTLSVDPIDRASASTRILLHDTQAQLEKFTDRLLHLTSDIDNAKRELVSVQKLYCDDHEQILDKMVALANRSQTELQKTIGSPAQRSELDKVAANVCNLSAKLEALDKKLDHLIMLNATQSQALQTIHNQQGQLLMTLAPILPLLQAVPLHIENARNQLTDNILGHCRCTVPPTSAIPGEQRGTPPHPHKRRRVHASNPLVSGDSISISPSRKKRRLMVADEHPGPETGQPAECTNEIQDDRHALRPSATSPLITRNSGSLHPPDVLLSTSGMKSSVMPQQRTPLRDLLVHENSATPTGIASGKSVDLTPGSERSRLPTAPSAVDNALLLAGNPGAVPRVRAHGHTAHLTARLHSPPAPASGLSPTVLSRRIASQSSAVKVSSTVRPPTGNNERSSVVPDGRGLATQIPSPVPPLSSSKPLISSELSHMSQRSLTTPACRPEASSSPSSAKARTPCVAASDGAWRSSMPPPGMDKPMSLKDRRAWFADARQREAGKRFIALDDEDDEDINMAS
ncbi:hypothetical protein PYCCODRAFT_1241398 [Trametes coccinea BRFM310]|uniref:Uncharacterized protein n=1 Tax=Trametes coccinea (strain BRFM310) TaxID=1353009 RepID=A0A1Y2IWI4_TRAC3|nr:hypothetical protein PYCCODRAFT_1241398 [Trametes coccinea BRFM310]